MQRQQSPVFHEKQIGQLCAQHCLNALLQGPYFSANDLADVAHQIDAMEREVMAAASPTGAAKDIPSANLDDTGYFSIQVLQRAISNLSLELIPFRSPAAAEARHDPASAAEAYICNLDNHWFTLRRLSGQWYNLNSLLDEPTPISGDYLALILMQMLAEGYSVFVVCGQLPDPATGAQLCFDSHGCGGPSSYKPVSSGPDLGSPNDHLSEDEPPPSDDVDLRRAIELSLERCTDVSGHPAEKPSPWLGSAATAIAECAEGSQTQSELSNDVELEQAIALSLTHEEP